MDGFVRDARDDRDARAVESDRRTHGGKTTHARTDVHSLCSCDDDARGAGEHGKRSELGANTDAGG